MTARQLWPRPEVGNSCCLRLHMSVHHQGRRVAMWAHAHELHVPMQCASTFPGRPQGHATLSGSLGNPRGPWNSTALSRRPFLGPRLCSLDPPAQGTCRESVGGA